MANVNIRIVNIDRIVNAYKQAPNIVAQEMLMAIKKVRVFGVGAVKETITKNPAGWWKKPIDTGTMRRGIQAQSISPTKIIIVPSSSTPYAEYVHEGTKRMQSRPFFDVTAKYRGKEIEQFFNDAINTAMRKIVQKAG
jgi:hypothetical protein